MKQPELGQKLTALRQEKNMTQEELVEACNVSVRTIQRIESGEVTPRISTIKIIIDALGEDIHALDAKLAASSGLDLGTMESFLQIAWISGIAAFVLGFIDTGIEITRMETDVLDIPLSTYLPIKIASLLSYIFFYVGMIKLGDYFENRLLSISGYLLMALMVLMTGSDIFSVFYEGTTMSWITIGTGLTMAFGSIGVVFGVGLLRLQDAMGKSSKFAGVLEIIGGICLITVILGIVSLIIYIPAMIIEIILLYNGYELIRAERRKM